MPRASSTRARTNGRERLTTFMQQHGLQTTVDLAQVFRVAQSTASRWMKDAAEKPLEDVLPGPAMILMELMEAGLTTSDLDAMRKLAAVHARPDELDDIAVEQSWTVEVPTRSRFGAKVSTPTGHHIIVHSGWIKDRMVKLEAILLSGDAGTRRRAKTLLARYQDVLQKMAELPR